VARRAVQRVPVVFLFVGRRRAHQIGPAPVSRHGEAVFSVRIPVSHSAGSAHGVRAETAGERRSVGVASDGHIVLAASSGSTTSSAGALGAGETRPQDRRRGDRLCRSSEDQLGGLRSYGGSTTTCAVRRRYCRRVSGVSEGDSARTGWLVLAVCQLRGGDQTPR